MKFEVEVTSHFKRQAKKLLKKYPSLKRELDDLIISLSVVPEQGVPLGKNCFKIRVSIASKSKGKSGGARVITYARVLMNKVYLLSIYDKSDMSTISFNELSDLLRAIE